MNYILDVDVVERFDTGELLITLNIGVLKVNLRLNQAQQLHLLQALFGSQRERHAYLPMEMFCPPLPAGKKYLQLDEAVLAVRQVGNERHPDDVREE